MGNGFRDIERKREAAARRRGETGAEGSVIHGATRSPKTTGIKADVLASAKAARATGLKMTPLQQEVLAEHEAPAKEAAAEEARLRAETAAEKEARRKVKRDAKAKKVAGNSFGTREVSAGVLEDPAAMSFAKRHNILA